jgi:hypothetical protein
VCPGTITRWLARAAKHTQAFSEQFDRIRDPVEFQFDEISARPANHPGLPLELQFDRNLVTLLGGRARRPT